MNSYKNFIFSALSILLLITLIVVYLYRVKIAIAFYGNSDFYKFYQSMRFYFSDQNIYQYTTVKFLIKGAGTWITSTGNLNPPFFTLLLFPLYAENYARALIAWELFSIVLLFASVLLVLKSFPMLLEKPWQKLAFIAGFFLYIPNSANLFFGQVTALILTLFLLSWLFARNGREILAGFLMGINCNIKLFFGLFIVYFLVIRRWQLFFSTLVTYCILLLTTLKIFGVENFLRYHAILEDIRWYTNSWNVSFQGFFMRLFSAAEHNRSLFNLPHLVAPLTYFCISIVMAYLIILWRRLRISTTPTQAKQHMDLGFSLTIIAILLISPLGWTYYFPLLIVPYFVLLEQSRYIHNGFIFLLMAGVALLLSNATGEQLKPTEVATLQNIFINSGFGFYAIVLFLIVFIRVCYLRLSQPQSSPLCASEISEELWLVIYSLLLLPSFDSLFHMMKHVIHYKLTGSVS